MYSEFCAGGEGLYEHLHVIVYRVVFLGNLKVDGMAGVLYRSAPVAAGRNSVDEEDEADLVLGLAFGAVAGGVRDLESMRLGVDDLLLLLAPGLGVSCKVVLDALGDCALEDCALEDCALEDCALEDRALGDRALDDCLYGDLLGDLLGEVCGCRRLTSNGRVGGDIASSIRAFVIVGLGTILASPASS